MLLLIETWSEACCWFSSCTNCSIVRCDSASHCSIHVNASAKAALWPCNRRVSSATNALAIGGVDRAMSAMTRIRLFGSRSAVSIIRSAQALARSRSDLPAAIRTPTRRRFSIKASRSMIGMAQSSPSFNVVTDW